MQELFQPISGQCSYFITSEKHQKNFDFPTFLGSFSYGANEKLFKILLILQLNLLDF